MLLVWDLLNRKYQCLISFNVWLFTVSKSGSIALWDSESETESYQRKTFVYFHRLYLLV